MICIFAVNIAISMSILLLVLQRFMSVLGCFSGIGWGKPRIFVKDLDLSSPKWEELPTPVENSTELTTTKGDKQEAKIEGGENEDVKYGKNTYALALNIRAAKGRKRPISDSDGVVAHNYAIALQPEDPDVQGFCMEKATVSVEDTFTTADGGIWAYVFDALKPEADKKQIQWGKIIVTESAGSISKIECDPEEESGEDDKFEVAPNSPSV